MKLEPFKFRFWSKVEKTDSCWLWTGTKQATGYGIFQLGGKGGGKRVTASRVSYQLAYGEFDHYLYVCHKCDNPSCVNPEHLFIGTQSDNMRDCSNKKRTNSKKLSKPYKIIAPNGEIVQGENLTEYARANGLNQGSLYNVMTGKAKRAYGYTKFPD